MSTHRMPFQQQPVDSPYGPTCTTAHTHACDLTEAPCTIQKPSGPEENWSGSRGVMLSKKTGGGGGGNPP